MAYKITIRGDFSLKTWQRKKKKKKRFIWFLQSDDFLQVSKNSLKRTKLICYDVGRLNESSIQIKDLNGIFHSASRGRFPKMQKRTGGVLRGGFVEIIRPVRGDRGYFFSPALLPVCRCAVATNWSPCNRMQNSDKWFLLQYIGSSLWLCRCPWHLLSESDVHNSLTYNGGVLKHLGLFLFSLDVELNILIRSVTLLTSYSLVQPPSFLSLSVSFRYTTFPLRLYRTCVCQCNHLIIIRCGINFCI